MGKEGLRLGNPEDILVAESIKLYRNDNQLMNDAIDRLLMEIYFYKKEYGRRTILLTGCGASNGTTTIAINLAIALSLAGWKTLLVDADLKKENKYKRVGKEVELGLSDYLEGRASISEITYSTNYSGLSYIACGAPGTSSVCLFCSERMENFIKEEKSEYEFVIFDTPSVTVVPDATVLFSSVDGIALVVSLNATTKKQLTSAKYEMGRHADKYYGLIINCVDKMQYGRLHPQYDYFGTKRMTKKYKKWIKKDEKAKIRELGVN